MKNKKNLISTILMFSAIFVVLVADILTKYLVYGKTGEFLPGFLRIDKAQNTGGPFSILSGYGILLAIVTILFLFVFLWYFLSKKKKSILFGIASGMIIGGAIGNLYDRLVIGYVRDFLSFDFFSFPTFNVADSFICIGVALMVIYLLFIYSKECEFDKKQLIERGFSDNKVNISTEDLDSPTAKRFSLKSLINPCENAKDKADKDKKAEKIND